VLKRADRVVALSAGWRESLRRLSPQARIEIIENAVEVPGRPPIRRHSDPVRLSFLSRMDQWKGVDDLLDACERLTTKSARFELSLAGPPGSAGDAKLFLEKIRRRGLDPFVHYVGERHGDDKSEFLRRADVFIQPSHHEGMPLAMLEAMSHGLPVIATKVGAIPEMITHGVHGLLVAPHRPEQLAEAIAVLVGDGDLRERMSQAARALVETRFSLRRWRADLARLYEELA
jgi:glycosyltransferase involved in cell wall biosynthesis